jgi:hypothetical protein
MRVISQDNRGVFVIDFFQQKWPRTQISEQNIYTSKEIQLTRYDEPTASRLTVKWSQRFELRTQTSSHRHYL